MNIKAKIGVTIGSIATITALIVLCLTSYSWFVGNGNVVADGLSVIVSDKYETVLQFRFDLFKHDPDDFIDPLSGYLVPKDDDGLYRLKMNSYDSIFGNIVQCGVVMKAKIDRVKQEPFTGNESISVTFARDASMDGDGKIFSARSSSVVQIHGTPDAPEGLSDDETNPDTIYRKTSEMFLNGDYEGKTFANIADHTKKDIVFTFPPDASRAGKSFVYMYFYITYNTDLVTLYQVEHYDEIDPFAETIDVPSDIKQFRIDVEGDFENE